MSWSVLNGDDDITKRLWDSEMESGNPCTLFLIGNLTTSGSGALINRDQSQSNQCCTGGSFHYCQFALPFSSPVTEFCNRAEIAPRFCACAMITRRSFAQSIVFPPGLDTVCGLRCISSKVTPYFFPQIDLRKQLTDQG